MAIDVSALSSDLNKYGGELFQKQVTDPSFKEHFEILTNVKNPIPLPRINTTGSPRPYRAQRDSSGNAIEFTDRRLIVNQSKWDFPDMDPEVFRNTYLAQIKSMKLDPATFPFYEAIVNKISKDYMSMINDNVVYLGSYNASGTSAAAIATGIGTIIADEITATNLTPITTGAIAASDAVTKFETFHTGVPIWMKERGYKILCSYNLFEKYTKHYRSLNGFGFDPNAGVYKLDGTMAEIHPVSFMGTSQRMIAIPNEEKVLFCGFDEENTKLYATPRLNLIEPRAMLPIGFQISDLDAIAVNDQA